MRIILTLFILIFSVTSFGQGYKVYRYKDKTIVVPKKEKKEIEGYGITIVEKVIIETVKKEVSDGTNVQIIEEKQASMWIGGCGKVIIHDEKAAQLKNGTMIRVRQGLEKCTIQSWEVFK